MQGWTNGWTPEPRLCDEPNKFYFQLCWLCQSAKLKIKLVGLCCSTESPNLKHSAHPSTVLSVVKTIYLLKCKTESKLRCMFNKPMMFGQVYFQVQPHWNVRGDGETEYSRTIPHQLFGSLHELVGWKLGCWELWPHKMEGPYVKSKADHGPGPVCHVHFLPHPAGRTSAKKRDQCVVAVVMISSWGVLPSLPSPHAKLSRLGQSETSIMIIYMYLLCTNFKKIRSVAL